MDAQRRNPFKPDYLTDLHDMLVRAAETERAMPRAIRKQKMASWPEFPQEWTAYGYDDDAEMRLPVPSPVAIDEYSYVMDLVLRSPEIEDRRLIWAAAHSAAYRDRGASWKKIGAIMLCDPRTAKRRYETALLALWYLV